MKNFKVITIDSLIGGENEVRSEAVISAKNPVELGKLLAKKEGNDLEYYKDWMFEEFKWKDLIDKCEGDEFMEDAEFLVHIGEEVFAVCKEIK
jgi:hypothetical protein